MFSGSCPQPAYVLVLAKIGKTTRVELWLLGDVEVLIDLLCDLRD